MSTTHKLNEKTFNGVFFRVTKKKSPSETSKRGSSFGDTQRRSLLRRLKKEEPPSETPKE